MTLAYVYDTLGQFFTAIAVGTLALQVHTGRRFRA